jgi:hypothetical protein
MTRTKADLKKWIKHGGGVTGSPDKLMRFAAAEKAFEDAKIAAALAGRDDPKTITALRRARDAAFLDLD